MTQQAQDYQTFQGRTVAEAMQKVTAALGRDAFIIEKRYVKSRKGLLKLGSEELVEFVATNSQDVAQTEFRKRQGGSLLTKTYCKGETQILTANAQKPAQPSPQNIPMWSVDEPVVPEQSDPAASESSPVAQAAPAAPSIPAPAVAGLGGDAVIEGVRAEILRLMSAQARGGLPPVGENLLDAYQHLLDADVAADIARELVESLQFELSPAATLSPAKVREGVCEMVGRNIRVAGPITLREDKEGPTVAVLMGPTGVGKTTTLVKIAFDFVMNKKMKVALITEDVKRPGAEAQLRNVTQLLNLPLVAADTPRRVQEELHHLTERGVDLVLIDTAGRVPQDKKALRELSAFLDAVQPDEKHLVLSSSSSERTALHIAKTFEVVGYDKVILSKLDEAYNFGLVLNLARKIDAGLSYCTSGQEYAKTLHEASATCLAQLVTNSARVGLDGEGIVAVEDLE